MKKTLTLARCLGLAALSGLACASSFAQSGAASSALPADVQELLKQAQKLQVKSGSGGVAKGWTCADPEDGKRMHVMDTTNIARMKSVPSSVEGFQDTTTPIQNLPTCSRPQ